MPIAARLSPLFPSIPQRKEEPVRWARLYGSSRGLAISQAAASHSGPVVVIVPDTLSAGGLDDEIRFYQGKEHPSALLHFPDWETLPYDNFSPHQDIVSERLATLYHLPQLERGILVVPVTTLMVRLPPRQYVNANTLMLKRGDRFDLDEMRQRLQISGYQCVGQVMEHGEFAVRGSLMDIYPMGSRLPMRIDLLDDEVDSLRTFDPESQRSLEKLEEIRLLPAKEFPMTEDGIARFRANWRTRFEGDPTTSPLYRDVSEALCPPGIEYYLPLFFQHTESLIDYFPRAALIIEDETIHESADVFWRETRERYEQRAFDAERPVLSPAEVFFQSTELFSALRAFPRIRIDHFGETGGRGRCDFATRSPTQLPIDGRATQPLAVVQGFLDRFTGRVLFVAETAGRREILVDLFRSHGVETVPFEGWETFLAHDAALGMTVATLEQGAVLDDPAVAVVTESQLFGARAMQRRRRKKKWGDAESIVRDLAELNMGAPVVHEDHGVGRYRGLQTLTVGGITNEFLTLEYAGGDKLYAPVSSLQLISRYTGTDPDLAPLHKLGTQQWQRARKKAAERVYDVAAELLEIHARRAARSGRAFETDEGQLQAFAQGFPFEETPDQRTAIDEVIADMASKTSMDRLVCGDVGFGKTEVALRAAHVAVHDGFQVAVLVPTTLLAQQHYQTFSDRFAEWPVRVDQLSRFRSKQQQDAVLKDLAVGKVDIVIGTHRLLQKDVQFKRLGLAIIDEEHRFGVRQKERLKALRSEVDILTLTATPIPRTLNMALSGIRELSLIGTPPERRLSIKTFVRPWDKALIREACQREIRRGGQIYFVHNRVEDIEKTAKRVEQLVPEATLRIAHGQMRERDLENVMVDFYHRRFNILVCTTIIETGIDVPSANTIIINRADRFGLAQLHQLRGRVGRSHHRAYAYLISPPRRAMTADAVKRLEAIESLEDLGIGFSLATHDLEIRGAGELLGDEQSGQIQEVGYTLYAELLERAVRDLKLGRNPQLDRPLEHGTEVDLHMTALIPEDYLPDVHSRLIMYKRIASAEDSELLRDLQVEMIDRFGLLPDAVKSLFRVTEIKLKATPLDIQRIDFGEHGGRIFFRQEPRVDVGRILRLVQNEPQIYALDGSSRLRVSMELPDGGARIRAVDDLLDALTTRDAA